MSNLHPQKSVAEFNPSLGESCKSLTVPVLQVQKLLGLIVIDLDRRNSFDLDIGIETERWRE
jgi:hypothetical protein